WLSTNVEAGVDDYRAAGFFVEAFEQSVVAAMPLRIDRLDTRRVVHMGYRRNRRASHVQQLHTTVALHCLFTASFTLLRRDRGYQEHVRALHTFSQVEVFWRELG